MFRLSATGFLLLISTWVAAAPVPPRDSVSHRDSTVKSVDSTTHKTPQPSPSSFHWPIDSSETVCREPLETAAECWRRSQLWAIQETGFPGMRSRTLSLSSLEPAAIEPFFQPAITESPYGLGGHMHFDRVQEGEAITEVWTPVLPVDTPMTSLHWTRGALHLNQFDLNLRRMVGDRAYFGFQIHSDATDSQFYEYPFNVHQPYLAGWGIPALKRDSLSLVLQDTSNKISATQLRPRLGFWIDSQTVVEAFGDWLENKSSLANPTNPARNDSTQLLYPASFSATTFGAVAARSTLDYRIRATVWHSDWNRELHPRGDSGIKFSEASSGSLNRLQTEVSPLWIPGQFRMGLSLQSEMRNADLRLKGVADSIPSARASSNREGAVIESRPSWGPLSLDLHAGAERRVRPDAMQEWLEDAHGNLQLTLPLNFKAVGEAGWKREGAGDESLFRWQPGLGFYPNPDLKPRTDLHLEAGGFWESRWIGLGTSWERHRYANNWLPRILPETEVCSRVDSAQYPRELQPVCPDNEHIPDSLALALVNYHEEIRDLLHLSLLLHLGNWRLSLLNTYLIGNTVKDPRLGFTELNRQLPERIFKGQLLWRRKVLDGKLGLQTQWDWEWTSTREVYASDLNGYSRALELDEYLALDFTARMEIKTFMLYFRAMNLNQDRYATEPGVHPPGVNFRFGIDWHLWN